MSARHGTRLMYRERCCRCAECRGWAADSMRRYTARVRVRDGVSPTQKYRPAKQQRPPGECSSCGKSLSQAGPNPMCTPCRKRLKRGIDIRPADRLAIYKRDGWVCGFCFGEVVATTKHPDPWAPSLDHIVPRSKGGSDVHNNLRLVHRYCNGVRSNRAALTLDELTAQGAA